MSSEWTRVGLGGESSAHHGGTADIVFPPGYLIWYLSQFVPLEPGELIHTGALAGAGWSTSSFVSIGHVGDSGIDGRGRHRDLIAV